MYAGAVYGASARRRFNRRGCGPPRPIVRGGKIMTDMEYIRMRQQEGRGGGLPRATSPAQRRWSRLAALTRLAHRARDGQPSGRLQRQP
jgi:hypothetical protein